MRVPGGELDALAAAAERVELSVVMPCLSYDLTHTPRFVKQFRSGSDLVMGNRFRGGIADQAMPFLHRYLGNPVLTAIGRLFFHSPCGDFHCGIRGFRRDSFLWMDIRSTGMEFASEMVVTMLARPQESTR